MCLLCSSFGETPNLVGNTLFHTHRTLKIQQGQANEVKLSDSNLVQFPFHQLHLELLIGQHVAPCRAIHVMLYIYRTERSQLICSRLPLLTECIYGSGEDIGVNYRYPECEDQGHGR